MVTILMMSAKMSTLGLSEINVFWNKNDDVIVFVCDATNKILSRDSNYIVNVVMCPNFGRISMREDILWKLFDPLLILNRAKKANWK